MSNLADRIISIFLENQTCLLTDEEIYTALTKQGIPCTLNALRRQAQLLSPGLFQIIQNGNQAISISVDPKIEICEEFLTNKCSAKLNQCDRLHLCRHFEGRCPVPKCHFPHDLMTGSNERIVTEHNCQSLDPILLVKLLRLKKTSGQQMYARGTHNTRFHRPRGRGRGRGRGLGRGNDRRGNRFTSRIASRNVTEKTDNSDLQVDVCFPSLDIAPQINLEIIEMLLSIRDIKLENKFDENENEYFRRVTIQLQQANDVENLLSSPRIVQAGADIKFKRTRQTIDKKKFLLKADIKDEQDKILPSHIQLYISIILQNNSGIKTVDLSTNSEQIILVECENDIDFNNVRQAYKKKSDLSGKHLTLLGVYEPDAVEIHYNETDKSISVEDLKTIFKSSWTEIFSFNFISEDCAQVEFINAKAFKQWISTVRQIENKYNLTITPIIDYADEIEDTGSVHSTPSVASNMDTRSISSFSGYNRQQQSTPSVAASNTDTRSISSSGRFNRPQHSTPSVASNTDTRSISSFSGFNRQQHSTTMQLNSDWILIANHPKFQMEYKQFIQRELEGDIDIHGNQVTYKGIMPAQYQGSKHQIVLYDTTDKFMKNFVFRTFQKLEQHNINLLLNNSADVAFRCLNENDYRIATRSNDMSTLVRKLFPKTRPGSHIGMNSPPNIERPSGTSTSIYSINTLEKISICLLDGFEERLKGYLQNTFNTKVTFERLTTNNNENASTRINRISIKLIGQMNDVENALQDLDNLFSSLNTKIISDTPWIKITNAIEVIQYQFQQTNLICFCQQISSTIVHFYYFDVSNPQFGIDDQQIDDFIHCQLTTATIQYSPQPLASNFTKECTQFENNIRQRKDYKKNICFDKESNNLYLFGLKSLVTEFDQNFRDILNRFGLETHKVALSDKQLKYLTSVAKANVNELAKKYKINGCDLNLVRLRKTGEFIAPSNISSKIKDNLEALAQIIETTFEIDEPGFETLVNKEQDQLLSLVKSKCYLEKTIETRRVLIPIPQSRTVDFDNEVKKVSSSTAATLPTMKSIQIVHSTVNISMGDLTAQAVDALVLSSSSKYLCKDIVNKAGDQVTNEYALLKSSNKFPGETTAGKLPCKRIFFIPWSSSSRDDTAVKSSLSTFISEAFQLALASGSKTMAFPAIGCGKLNFDPSMIAKYMLEETRKQLKVNKIKMSVSFILLPNQQTVYDAFIKYLNEMETIDLQVSQRGPTKKQAVPLAMPYDRKIIKINLISSTENNLRQCKQDIIDLARSCSTKSQLTNREDILNWSQNTINKYYEYCLKQNVIPTIDVENLSLELVGSKDAVHEAEKCFLEFNNETLRAVHMHTVARGIIWSIEELPKSDRWEQYSFKLNGIIEDAFIKKHPHIEFQNDAEAKCRIVFSSMEQHNGNVISRVRRKNVDSTLPNTWEASDQNCKRVTLNISSSEYQDVLARFHVTMLGKYSQLVKIERIQNERWYKQYDAHREDFQRRYSKIDERLLFHGCPTTSADQIIGECFNRSFAGINGVLYGNGVYFHSQASYSHQYAKPNNAGERNIFLVRVLIGKTCTGNSGMKTPPSGYDTTTDGQNIFVVYHDAGAYADHLITYK